MNFQFNSLIYLFHLLLQLARCEERLGLVEQSLSSTQDQLSARVSEVRRNLIGSFIDRLLTGLFRGLQSVLKPNWPEIF